LFRILDAPRKELNLLHCHNLKHGA
jgi:hypothetical protein